MFNLRQNVAIPMHRAVIHCAEDVGGYWASCDFENGGCTVQGDTLHDIQKNMLEALELYFEDFPDVTDYYVVFEYSGWSDA
jgi:predicted RNase H-like HicB family nuclease